MDKFYQFGNVSSGMTSLTSVQASSLQARSMENANIDLTGKTVPELIEFLSHRDNDLKQRACGLLKAKAVESKDAADVRVRDQTKEYLYVPVVVQTLFQCATIDTHPVLQADILTLVSGIMTEQLKDRIRQVGCIPQLASLWKRGTEESLLSKILSLTQELTTNEQNCLACKQTKRVPELCNLLLPEVHTLSVGNRSLLIGILRNLSKVPKNRDQISKTAAPTQMLKLVNELWKIPLAKGAQVPGKDAMLTQQILETLSNLALGAVLKTSVTPEQFQMLAGMLDGKKTIKRDWMTSAQKDQEFFIMTCIQCQLLQLIAHLSTFDGNRRILGQLNAVQLLLIFCLPGEACIPADGMFYWVDAMDHLIQLEDYRAIFLKYRGLSIALQFITSPKTVEHQQHRQLNHRAIDLIITCASHGTQDDETLNTVVQTLILYATQNTDDLTLQSKIVKTLHHLSNNELHCNGLARIPGLMDFITRHILETEVAEIIEAGVAFLANMGAVPQIKRHLNSMAKTLVPGLLSYLGNDNPQLQTRITKLMAQVFATDSTGAKILVDYSCVLVMLTLISSPVADLQEQALAVLDQLIPNYPNGDELRHSYMASGVIAPVVNLLSSDGENVQIRALSVISRLIDHRACRMTLESLGVAKKLEDLKKKHPVKPNRSDDSKDSHSVSLNNMIDTIMPKLSGTIADLNSAISMTHEDPNAATDALLSKLTKWQLVQLVKYALNNDPEMMTLVNDTIQANIVNPPVKKQKGPAVHVGIDSTSITAESGLKPILMVPAPPPPSAPKKSAGGSAPPPPLASSSSRANPASVFDQLTSLAKTGAIKLKKVDTEKEIQEKAKERARSNTPMASIFQGIKETSSHPEGTKLLEQGTTNGRQFWVKDPSKYVETIQASFKLDYNFMKILLHLISSTVSTVSFDSLLAMAHKKDTPIDPQQMADTLRNLGFTTKHNMILLPDSDTPKTQFTQVIVPGDLPTQMISNTIVWTVSQSTPSFVASLPASLKSSLTSGNAPSSSSAASSAPSASSASSSVAPFQCRLCQNSFPESEAIDVNGRQFCKACSEVVLDALKKRAQQQ